MLYFRFQSFFKIRLFDKTIAACYDSWGKQATALRMFTESRSQTNLNIQQVGGFYEAAAQDLEVIMKVESSKYLKQVKPLLKKLQERLLSKYSYASVLAADSVGKQYSVSKSGIVIQESGSLSERGFVVKVYDGTGYGEYSFNEITEDSVEDVFETICEELMRAKPLPQGVDESKYVKPADDRLVFSESTEYEESPIALGDDKIIEMLTSISEKGRAFDERIMDCRVQCVFQKYSKLFLSENRDMEQNVMWMSGGLVVLTQRKEEIKNCFRSCSALGGAEILKEMEGKLEDACKTAIELLDSKSITPGEYECICTPDVTGMIVHEAFGHGVEMDMFVKKRAQAEQFIGKYVASPLITMRDGAATIRQVASYFFDDEGVPAHDTVIIDKGILKTGICDSQSAMHLGIEPSGNGRRESTERKAYTRMTNTIFEAGDSTLEEMISSIKYGFLIQDAESGMEDPKNWGIQCMVNIAREIKNGKLTGNIFSPIVLTGYVPDLLKSISMISNNIEASGSGFCGKGYKEWVKVSDGGPYIKAKIRLG